MIGDVAQDSLILIKNAMDTIEADMPPLGTQTDVPAATAEDGTEAENTPDSAAWEVLTGHASLRFKTGREINELTDYNEIKKMFEFGLIENEAALEHDKYIGNHRVEGAQQGLWDPATSTYSDRRRAVKYDIWILIGPDEFDLTATSAEAQIKLYDVIIADTDESREAGKTVRQTHTLKFEYKELIAKSGAVSIT